MLSTGVLQTKSSKVIAAMAAMLLLAAFQVAVQAIEKPLAARKKFKVTITTGVRDAANNPLANNVVWTFTTGSS